MDKKELNEILENHKKWLENNGGQRADLTEADLTQADLTRADLRGAYLAGADLRGANLRGADLTRANLTEADLTRANLTEADLAGAYLAGANLTEADLAGAYLAGADLTQADLTRANLRGANLRGAYLRRANLRGANLTEANLTEADLTQADLRGADLSGLIGLLSAINYMTMTFDKTVDGYIVYKTFGLYQAPCPGWEIKNGAVVSETVNPNRTDDCGSGVNVATLDWVCNERKKLRTEKPIWKCLIRWEWLSGVVVPYNTDGKIRCEKVELIEIVKEG